MTCTATPTTGLLEPISRLPPDEVIFGSSSTMCKIRQKLEKAAGANIAVLLRGQSGTGKEVLAKLIHSQSPLRNGPFVKVSRPASLNQDFHFCHPGKGMCPPNGFL